MGRRKLSLIAACATLSYLSYILFYNISIDFTRTKKCDTTYINPSYHKVALELGNQEKFKSYSLVKYKEVHSYWVPKTGMMRNF